MGRRNRGRALDGILVVDKPQGLTSNGVVSRLKRWTKARKVGHTGALDPMATGVLPVVFGEATKFSQYGLEANKGYIARVQLGTATSTLDADGEVIAQQNIPFINEALLHDVLQSLTGNLMQIPPMVSALKHQGQPLYKLARQGIEIERTPRAIQISVNELLEFDAKQGWLKIRVHCSKGTYIRSLAESIADQLHTVAHLSALRRELCGGFTLDHSHSWLALQSAFETAQADPGSLLKPMDAILEHFPRVDLTENECMTLIQGKKVSGKGVDECGIMRAYFAGERFIGLVFVDSEDVIAAKRMLSPVAAGMRGIADSGQ
jgi:tRNA pseudouridine55 synthase